MWIYTSISPIHLHGIVLNLLSTGRALPYVPPKRQQACTRPHSVTSQKTELPEPHIEQVHKNSDRKCTFSSAVISSLNFVTVRCSVIGFSSY
jgi:hypothetical protein